MSVYYDYLNKSIEPGHILEDRGGVFLDSFPSVVILKQVTPES